MQEDIVYQENSINNPSDAEDCKEKVGSSWFHRQRTRKRSKNVYDIHSRNPLYAGAEFINLWELLFLKDSFHPSVSLFAHQFSNSKEIKYSGDPLLDFTTSRFLDRFVYRNPKKQPESLDQNVHNRVFGNRKLKSRTSKLLPVSSNEYLQQKSQNVPVEEQFIYQYLQKRAASKTPKGHDSDIESVCSEDFQKLLDDVSICFEYFQFYSGHILTFHLLRLNHKGLFMHYVIAIKR